jgi:hypothetical protein
LTWYRPHVFLLPKIALPLACLIAAGFVAELVAAGVLLWRVTHWTITGTDAEIHVAWATWALVEHGAFAFVVSVVALTAYALAFARYRKVAHASAWVAAAIVALTDVHAAVTVLHRLHPAPDQKEIAASFPLPAAWGPGSFYVDPGDKVFGPRVDRVVDVPMSYAEACTAVERALDAWPGARRRGPERLDLLPPSEIGETGFSCGIMADSPEGWTVFLGVGVRPTAPNRFARPCAPREICRQNIAPGVARVTVRVLTPGG